MVLLINPNKNREAIFRSFSLMGTPASIHFEVGYEKSTVQVSPLSYQGIGY